MRPELRRVVVLEPEALRARFPSAPLSDHGAADPVVVDEAWDAPDADLLAFDAAIHGAEDAPFDLVLRCRRPSQCLLRWQRLFPATNGHSRARPFQAALAAHASLHDRSLPLVRADLDHAHDVWQWTLRLDPDASVEVQLAALLHDVERLESEPTRRVEHLAADYDAFKAAHARRGAELARDLLGALFPSDVVDRVADLVAAHEGRAGGDRDLALLADADGLSFFGLNSAGYLRWFGPDQTRRKVAWTLRRLSTTALPWLAELKLPRGVAEAALDASRQVATPVGEGDG
jgi:hypothetical protein